jgi:CHASE2 domain-containing sensor protein
MRRLTARHPSPFRGSRRLLLVCGCALTVIMGALAAATPPFLAHLDGRFLDSLLTAEAEPRGYRPPVVVAVDDASLARFGRWPWPRALVARLLAGIAAQKPASVGVDAIFAEPEQIAGPGTLAPGDRALADALTGGPFVLGYELTFPPHPAVLVAAQSLRPLRVVILSRQEDPAPRQRFWQATGVVASLPEFNRSAAGSGFLNAATDPDGILRRMPVLMELEGKLFPSLALATALAAAGDGPAVLESTWTGERLLKAGELRIPLDGRGRLLLRYRGWHGRSDPIPAAALLEGRRPPDELRGRVVFVGATATGMGEAVVTPADRLLSGVQVHGIAAENMLRGDFARTLPWTCRLPVVLVLGLASTLACIALPLPAGAILHAATAGGAWLGAAWLFRSHGILLSPVLPLLLLAANFSLLTLLRACFGEKQAQQQSSDLAQSRDFIMSSLASLAEIRDTETGAHILRTQRYLLSLCRELARQPRFRHLLTPGRIDLVSKLAPLHDIGKVGLPDHLLRKTSGFTAEEYEEVKRHVLYGRDAIAKAEARVGMLNGEMLQIAKDMAYCHHERWDGSGYPEGLKGEEIPWAGRLMALADAYDAMVSRRVYKEPIPHEEAVGFISRGRGIHFDPDVVDAFLRVEAEWRQIAGELADEAEMETSG